LKESQARIGGEIVKELQTRLGFLVDVGLHYLSLNRSARSLSGGEAQRIRLATQIGSQLVNVLYILDEPSIGLHQRDNMRLIRSLERLRDLGNSVIVVEHDEDMMRAANHIVDLGPRAGLNGGRVVAQGDFEGVAASNSLTGQYLRGELRMPLPEVRRPGNGHFLRLIGATGNNLKNVTLEVPLGTLTVVSGVSGSGKSTLINHTLYPALAGPLHGLLTKPAAHEALEGMEYIDKVIDVDQSPIGRTPRSNPATYTNVFNDIRKLFSDLPEAKVRGYAPGRFSFNVKGGRCETCQGGGMRVVEMNFLPDVYVPCETCQGKRFNRETLEVRYKGKSISDVLNLPIEDALTFCEAVPKIKKVLQTLVEVGLGYITLGQPSTTLSGGEAQRIKLATELCKRDTGRTLYILDEPTTGLHFEDIRILMKVIQRLVSKGNTALIIEHNLDVIAQADYIVDMGPEGGKAGGTLVAAGTPEDVAVHPDSITAPFLARALQVGKN
ncbi:MAG: excinuclease ABC subunit UvrA, partial [Schleiferiaceae bacterium]